MNKRILLPIFRPVYSTAQEDLRGDLRYAYARQDRSPGCE